MKIHSIVIGAGVVGLAIAKKLVASGRSVLVVEANDQIGKETSFRNSAVLHAGIYYPRDSLKAKLCVIGKAQLDDYCVRHQIPYKKIGKLIVATEPSQLVAIDALWRQAQANGVLDIQRLDAVDVKRLEPAVTACAALYSPSTSTVDGKVLMYKYQKEFEALSGKIKCNARVLAAQVLSSGFCVQTANETWHAKELINAAGLGAQQVAASIEGLSSSTIPPLYYAKGNYFRYKGKQSPFSRLIYPLPEKAGLGIHATVDVAGTLRFGPDVEWVERLDFSINHDKKHAFYTAIKAYFPAIRLEDLEADFVGIRPKSKAQEQQPQDFTIHSVADHGIKNLINLYGIESPGLTCSLAIADYVHQLLQEK